MNTVLEDRLRAALNARADQFRPEDLRPAEVPQTRYTSWRGRGYGLLAAAAGAAVVSAPFVLNRAPEGGSNLAPAAPQSSTTTTHQPKSSPKPAVQVPTKTMPLRVYHRQQTDVDGEGTPDQVRLLARSDRQGDFSDVTLQVRLSSGGTVETKFQPSWLPGLLAPIDINGDGGSEIMTRAEGGDSDQLSVFTFSGGRLVEAVQPDNPLLMTGWTPDYHDVRYWFAGGNLFSYTGLQKEKPWLRPPLKVEVFSWTVQGTRLLATSLGIQCVNPRIGPEPHPC